MTDTHKRHLDIIAELVEKHDLEKDNNAVRRSQCWIAIHLDFVRQTGYTQISKKQVQKKWSNYIQNCKVQYSKGLPISDVDNHTAVEIDAKDEKSLKTEDSYRGSWLNKSKVRHKKLFPILLTLFLI